jgi:hypothetical protein
MPQAVLWRGLLEGLIELVSSLKEVSRNFIFSFLPKIAAKKCETISDHIDGKGTIF